MIVDVTHRPPDQRRAVVHARSLVHVAMPGWFVGRRRPWPAWSEMPAI